MEREQLLADSRGAAASPAPRPAAATAPRRTPAASAEPAAPTPPFSTGARGRRPT